MRQQRLFGRFWVLTRIDLKHFKCFDLLKLPLRPLTVRVAHPATVIAGSPQADALGPVVGASL